MGDLVELTLVVEIMGRHSNIVLVDHSGRIIDAIKRIDAEMSSVRQILPGMLYQSPPLQEEKLDLLNTRPDQAVERVAAAGGREISKALLQTVQGMSPLTCRESGKLCSSRRRHPGRRDGRTAKKAAGGMAIHAAAAPAGAQHAI